MVLLTTFLTPISILSTWTAVQDKVKGFMSFFLLLETGMLGVFLAQDMILFYVFWEFTLIPMYFLIGIWGGERRIYAAVKFFLFTMAGSVLMLVAMLWMGLSKGTFSVPDLMNITGFFPATLPGLCSWLLRWHLPSKYPCSRCIPGCRMPMWKRQLPDLSSWPVSC